MTDPFAHSDAAYVLGALPPEERAEYEAHLAECPACQARVSDLTPLPGLLAGLPAEAFDDVPDSADDPLPDTLLPRLLRAARAERRRGRRIVGALAGVAAACIAALVITLATVTGGDGGPAPLAMTALRTSPIHATASLQDHAWGTQIDLVCRYAATSGTPYPTGGYIAEAYRLVVHDRAGGSQVLGSWTIVAGRDVHYRSGTALPRDDIASIEIVPVDGPPILRLSI